MTLGHRNIDVYRFFQIVSNLSVYFSLEELLGREVVVLVNMKSSKIRGVESEGLILSAFK